MEHMKHVHKDVVAAAGSSSMTGKFSTLLPILVELVDMIESKNVLLSLFASFLLGLNLIEDWAIESISALEHRSDE